MKIQYSRDSRSHYLILTGGAELSEHNYMVQMVRENQMERFLPCRAEDVDEEKRFLYDVTSRQPLTELAGEKKVTAALLRSMIEALRTGLRQTELYLLPPDGIVLRPDCVFGDFGGGDICFCYYPAYEKNITESLRELSEYFLPRLASGDREAVVLGYAFYQTCAKDAVTAESLSGLLYTAGSSGKRQEVPGNEPALSADGSGADKNAQPSAGEERARILDDFFYGTEEDAEKEEQKEGKGGRRKVYAAALAAAVIAAAAGILTGYEAAGCCAAGLLFFSVVFGIRIRSYLAERRREEQEDDAFWKNWENGADLHARPESTGSGGTAENAEKPASRDVPAEYEEYPPPGNADHAGSRAAREEQDDWMGGATVYLEEGMAPAFGTGAAWLIPDDPSSDKSFQLGKKTMRIGKNQLAAEICIRQPAVSRMHAKIAWNGSAHVLTDLRSKNGTYLNGEVLEAGTEYELCDGDRIRFAGAEFLYEMR